ncbi:MAG: hypothetical protein WCD76_11070 [Pyrinomonadaceae bacterium]
MEKLNRRIGALLLMFVAVLVVTSGACAQTAVDVSVSRGPHPAWEGKAGGAVQPLERKDGDDLKTAVLGQPAPDIWLEFKEGEREGQPARPSSAGPNAVIKVDLPPEAQPILKSFWEGSLKFVYRDLIAKDLRGQARIDADMVWGSYCQATRQKLQQIEIAAPDGRRTVSDKEADDLVYFINKATASLIRSAQEK